MSVSLEEELTNQVRKRYLDQVENGKCNLKCTKRKDGSSVKIMRVGIFCGKE